MNMDNSNITSLVDLPPTIPIEGDPYSVYLKSFSEDKVELVVKANPDRRIISALKRSFPSWISNKIVIEFDKYTKDLAPLYRSGYFLLPNNHIESIKEGSLVKPIKPRSDKQNYHSFIELWDTWASKYISNGIYVTPYIQGKNFVLWTKLPKIFINGNDVTDQLPEVYKELSSFEDMYCLTGRVCAYNISNMKVKSSRIKITAEQLACNLDNPTSDLEGTLVFYVDDIMFAETVPQNGKPLEERLSYLKDLQTKDYQFLYMHEPIKITNIAELQDALIKYKPSYVFRTTNMLYPAIIAGSNKSADYATLRLKNDIDYTMTLRSCPYLNVEEICPQSICELSSQYICNYLKPEYYGLKENAFKYLLPSPNRSTMDDIEELLEMESISGFTSEELADKLRLNGILLAPGLWNGLWYSPVDIKKMYNKYKDRLSDMTTKVMHTWDHKYRDKDVGKKYNVTWNDQLKAITYRTDIDDQDAIKDVQAGKYGATSLMLKVNKVYENGIAMAKNIEPVNNSLVDVPACKTCRITYFEEMAEGGNEYTYYGVIKLGEPLVSDSNDDQTITEDLVDENIICMECNTGDDVVMTKCFYCNEEVEDLALHLKNCVTLKEHYLSATPNDPPADDQAAPPDDTPAGEPVVDAPPVPDTPVDQGTAPTQPIDLPINIRITTSYEPPKVPVVEEPSVPEPSSAQDDSIDDDGGTQADDQSQDDASQDTEDTASTDDQGDQPEPPTQASEEEIIKEASGLENLDILADLITKAERDKGKWQ